MEFSFFNRVNHKDILLCRAWVISQVNKFLFAVSKYFLCKFCNKENLRSKNIRSIKFYNICFFKVFLLLSFLTYSQIVQFSSLVRSNKQNIDDETLFTIATFLFLHGFFTVLKKNKHEPHVSKILSLYFMFCNLYVLHLVLKIICKTFFSDIFMNIKILMVFLSSFCLMYVDTCLY